MNKQLRPDSQRQAKKTLYYRNKPAAIDGIRLLASLSRINAQLSKYVFNPLVSLNHVDIYRSSARSFKAARINARTFP